MEQGFEDLQPEPTPFSSVEEPLSPEEEAVEWFFPTGNKKYADWEGGIIGTLAVNDYYNKNYYHSYYIILQTQKKIYFKILS